MFNEAISATIICPLYKTRWDQTIDKDVFSRMEYIQHDNYIYKVDYIIAADPTVSASDAIVVVNFQGNTQAFVNEF